jgi:hypothetical protein
MSQLSLKELVAVESQFHNTDLGFDPKMRIQELRNHFEDIRKFGSKDIETVRAMLGECNMSYDNEEPNRKHTDNKPKFYIHSISFLVLFISLLLSILRQIHLQPNLTVI